MLSLRLCCYIYWKFIRLYEHDGPQHTKVPLLAIFGTFSQKSAEIKIKDDKTLILFTVTCKISTLHTGNNVV